ncbi:hypothetical protein EVAR_46353_1 [Eumeta japonica]|uniref:Uncharacterized protein n=1 Tax=Eumeta variegata TaxID=151549 RepID=A0A4C1WY71_EUMVA|nr:hypothetical protein EVAR_46353_1 [Eumeta japonica]
MTVEQVDLSMEKHPNNNYIIHPRIDQGEHVIPSFSEIILVRGTTIACYFALDQRGGLNVRARRAALKRLCESTPQH